MPVTAKLSRRFYETLGDDVANELVDWFNKVDAAYRLDLREFNETNFARFDAKLEQRLAQFDASVAQRIAHLEVKLEHRLAEFEQRLDQKIEARLAAIEEKLDRKIEARLAGFEARLDTFEARQDAFEGTVARRFTRVETQITDFRADLRVEIARVETRLTRMILVLWVTTALGLLGLYFR